MFKIVTFIGISMGYLWDILALSIGYPYKMNRIPTCCRIENIRSNPIEISRICLKLVPHNF